MRNWNDAATRETSFPSCKYIGPWLRTHLVSFYRNTMSTVTSPPRPPPPPSPRPTAHLTVAALPAQTPPEPPYSRRPRQSFPPESILPSTSSTDSLDPFSEQHTGSESLTPAAPPPLPRRNGSIISIQHTPETSSDSGSSSAGSSSSHTSTDQDVVVKPPAFCLSFAGRA